MRAIETTVILILAVFILTRFRSSIAAKRRKAVLRICSIPLDWRSKGDVSRLQLAKRSGIATFLHDLTVEEVMDCLDRHPDLIDQWETDISDRRGSGGWAYGGAEDGYQLSEIGEGMAPTRTIHFKSRTEGCAVFVLLSTASYLTVKKSPR
jgi:hypothetical protein